MSAGKRGRPKGEEPPMERRQVFLPREMWEQLQAYAIELAVQEGKQVSTSEALRRIVDRSLKRRNA